MHPKNEIFNDPTLLMSEVKKARLDLKQEHIDFYRPVCHKEVLDVMHKQTNDKLEMEKAKKSVVENR